MPTRFSRFPEYNYSTHTQEDEVNIKIQAHGNDEAEELRLALLLKGTRSPRELTSFWLKRR
ncbi:hypothetical protein C4D60_Mb03t15680 [Musa balbisiana]|uniref:Uncharacterized protein n=1 Tax=Musa balbisiana TaxID=52838 RepID=A0A4S8JBY3_MUSBA|nr:hypothetical protein C4D60_Mb03t15680 [Musa balbisiana]